MSSVSGKALPPLSAVMIENGWTAVEYPNGSRELYFRKNLFETAARGPFGRYWRQGKARTITNRSTGDDGISRLGRRWHLHMEHGVGWVWR